MDSNLDLFPFDFAAEGGLYSVLGMSWQCQFYYQLFEDIQFHLREYMKERRRSINNKLEKWELCMNVMNYVNLDHSRLLCCNIEAHAITDNWLHQHHTLRLLHDPSLHDT